MNWPIQLSVCLVGLKKKSQLNQNKDYTAHSEINMIGLRETLTPSKMFENVPFRPKFF